MEVGVGLVEERNTLALPLQNESMTRMMADDDLEVQMDEVAILLAV